jgi:hypothetical protein
MVAAIDQRIIDFLKDGLDKISIRLDSLSVQLNERFDVLSVVSNETSQRLGQLEATVKAQDVRPEVASLQREAILQEGLPTKVYTLEIEVRKHKTILDILLWLLAALVVPLGIAFVIFAAGLTWQLLTHGQPVINWLFTGTPTP